MKSNELAQLTRLEAEPERIGIAGREPVWSVTLTLHYLQEDRDKQTPPLLMSPDQARTVASFLLSAADKADRSARS